MQRVLLPLQLCYGGDGRKDCGGRLFANRLLQLLLLELRLGRLALLPCQDLRARLRAPRLCQRLLLACVLRLKVINGALDLLAQ